MFIEDISEEAYLSFMAEWCHRQYVVRSYLFNSPHPSADVEVRKIGYVSVEGDIPDKHNRILLFDPTHNKNFVPIRRLNNSIQLISGRTTSLDGVGWQRLNELGVASAMENRSVAMFIPVPNNPDKYTVRMRPIGGIPIKD